MDKIINGLSLYNKFNRYIAHWRLFSESSIRIRISVNTAITNFIIDFVNHRYKLLPIKKNT